MNNLHRELAPVSEAAWASLEEEARRTFALHVAGRRVADVTGPDGLALAGLGTGHMTAIEPPAAHEDTQAPAASDADSSPPANRVTSSTLRPDSTRPGPGAADTEPR